MKKITTEEFIIKANKVHNNKYLYNKSVYTKTNKNIIKEDIEKLKSELKGQVDPTAKEINKKQLKIKI